MIKNQEYVFASVEFNPNHQSHMIAKLSSDEIEELSEELFLEEIKMDEVTISKEEYDALKEKAEKVTELESALSSANEKIVSLESNPEVVEPKMKNLSYQKNIV
ncbi:MAG: hypothetical protein HC874_32100 [Richelia sp. SL_2_1]|nr:hypothetical protein [Richelia sp. SL_2_1]